MRTSADDVIKKVVLPRWGVTTSDGVVLKATEWGKLLGVNGRNVIEPRVRRLRVAEQGKGASVPQGPTATQQGAIRGAKSAIKKYPELAKNLVADPAVSEAATKALVDTGNVQALSKATAAAAKNKQVERNRKRASEGEKKARSVLGPKPTPFTPEVTAFMTMKAQSTALRALVTDFPKEWANLSDEARTEDLLDLIMESFDKIQVALDNCRTIVEGRLSDEDLEMLLSGVSEHGSRSTQQRAVSPHD